MSYVFSPPLILYVHSHILLMSLKLKRKKRQQNETCKFFLGVSRDLNSLTHTRTHTLALTHSHIQSAMTKVFNILFKIWQRISTSIAAKHARPHQGMMSKQTHLQSEALLQVLPSARESWLCVFVCFNMCTSVFQNDYNVHLFYLRARDAGAFVCVVRACMNRRKK